MKVHWCCAPIVSGAGQSTVEGAGVGDGTEVTVSVPASVFPFNVRFPLVMTDEVQLPPLTAVAVSVVTPESELPLALATMLAVGEGLPAGERVPVTTPPFWLKVITSVTGRPDGKVKIVPV